MRPFRSSVLMLMLSAIAVTPALAGKFSTWTGRKTEVTIRVPDPPQAYLGKKTARVEVQPMPGEIGTDRMKLTIEQGLASELGIDNASPEVVIRVTLVHFRAPEAKSYALNEQQMVKVGEKTVYNKKGQPHQEDVYEQRAVPVQYWEGTASLSLHVEATARDGASLDIFDPQPSLNLKFKISVGGEATPEAHSVPDQTRMLDMLVQAAGNDIRKRYTRTDRNEMVILAIDDELAAGNSLAQAGKWGDALKMWDSVQMKKNPSDRVYNMAVAYEVLAYETYRKTQDVDEASKSFAKAMDMYAQALQNDPGEKYIRLASSRIARAKESMDRAGKQYAAQQFEVQKRQNEISTRRQREDEIAAAISEGASGGKGIKLADSPGEAKFRLFVRTRLAAADAEPGDDEVTRLASDGQQRYQLDQERCRHMVYQEVGWKRNHDRGMKAYREDFTIYAKDNFITADERSLLQDTARQYGLSAEDVQSIESTFKIREAGKAIKATPNSPPAHTKPVAKTKAK